MCIHLLIRALRFLCFIYCAYFHCRFFLSLHSLFHLQFVHNDFFFLRFVISPYFLYVMVEQNQVRINNAILCWFNSVSLHYNVQRVEKMRDKHLQLHQNNGSEEKHTCLRLQTVRDLKSCSHSFVLFK